MIEVTKLDGSKYWVNPHMIESMETNPDLTLSMLSGKKLVLRDTPSEVIERIIAYRKKIGINTQEVL
ncbi:MAG: flagellar FlbD family protein [Treponema sp.]|nr:flagellar FlbD family protein [Treponema sp.]